jgi:hypothetical protein
MTPHDLVYRAAMTAWESQCRLDTLTALLAEAGEYGWCTAEWLREREQDFTPIFQGLSEAAGILHAALMDLERL